MKGDKCPQAMSLGSASAESEDYKLNNEKICIETHNLFIPTAKKNKSKSIGNEVPVLGWFHFLLYWEIIDYSELTEQKVLRLIYLPLYNCFSVRISFFRL